MNRHERQEVELCETTGNPVGTNTWMLGHDCECGPCQRMQVRKKLAEWAARTDHPNFKPHGGDLGGR
jgi:hypothetical protein